MVYCLKLFDEPLIRFSADEGANANIKILWINTEKENLLPLDLGSADAQHLFAWLRHRSIPKNRAYVDSLLNSMGLSINRPMDIIKISKGLSLNDCYWITEEGFSGTFDRFNLFENRFSRILGQIAFTGYTSSFGSVISSSPEFTTNGMLPKCWRRVNGMVSLYKGGTEGASNTGNEPYSEYYACQIARILGFDAVSYNLSKWKGRLCSTCDLFTSIDLSFVPVGRILKDCTMETVREYYESLGPCFVNALDDMIVFDALIFNTDRHFGNFGFLVDSRTNRIVAPAPLFDHGNSLFNLVGLDLLQNKDAFLRYADHLLPCVYDDFTAEAKKVLSHERKNAVRKLLDVKLKPHPRYNLSKERLSLLETAVRERAKKLLED